MAATRPARLLVKLFPACSGIAILEHSNRGASVSKCGTAHDKTPACRSGSRQSRSNQSCATSREEKAAGYAVSVSRLGRKHDVLRVYFSAVACFDLLRAIDSILHLNNVAVLERNFGLKDEELVAALIQNYDRSVRLLLEGPLDQSSLEP